MQYFKQKEFECKCCGEVIMDEHFLRKLDTARLVAGIPFRINSAYRCPSYNKSVGGVDGSAHTLGLAVDIRCKDSSSRFKILQALMMVGFKRIGIYKTFIHVDSDTTKPQNVTWLGK